MKRYSTIVLMLLVGLSAAVPAAAQDYGKKVSKAWQQVLAIAKEDGDYRWSGYPVDNFGLATFYDAPKGKKWTDSDRICATWTCLNVAPAAIPAYVADPPDPNADGRLGLNGFADVGQGSSVTLDTKQSKDIGIKLLLPGLAQVLNLGANIDWKRGVTTVITIQKIYKRSANRDKLLQFIGGPDNKNQTLKNGFANARLSWVAADILATGVELKITVDNKTNADADVKLTQAAAVIAKDSSLNFKFASTGAGTYTLTIDRPLVLAVQTRSQPGALMLTEDPAAKDVIVDKELPGVTFAGGQPVEKSN